METKEKENILPDTEGMSGENNISGGKNVKKKLSKKTRIIILIDEILILALVVTVLVLQSHPEHMQALQEAANTLIEEEVMLQAEELSEAETITFSPKCTAQTEPSKLIASTSIQVDGETFDDIADYQPDNTISFGAGSEYTSSDGVLTFRGNNFRSSPAYGLANMSEYILEPVWTQSTGSMSYNGKAWNGNGWTGQPLITSWSKELRQHMNMYDWAKAQNTLTEVIYASLDGRIYFMELETGKATRDVLNMGYVFKGAGALDPRGYPILYVGAGYTSSQGNARVFVISLLDGSVLYTFGNDDTFADRRCFFFDSSALVDAKTDTLIYPGESGVLYLIHLNTEFHSSTGILTMDPDRVVKWKYRGVRTSSQKYWLGMEDSAVTYQHYIFMADNGGNLMCLDLNTLELVWVQDTLDDTNGSPVLSVENGHLYLYISPSFHLGWRSSSTATVPIFKIDAEDGSIVWQTDYECYSVTDVSGGVQSTIALGRNQLDDYIYCTVSRTGGISQGVLTCLDKKTGEIVWEHKEQYAWSSPVCVYNEDGEGNVLYCSSSGKMFLINGLTGEERYALKLSDGVIEASPAVYENMAVVGIRANKIYGIQLK